MSDEEQRDIQLQQLAHIVIDAYLNRDDSCVPVFACGVEEVIFLDSETAHGEHPSLKPNFSYRRSDYESGDPS
jgi:hypothetical protein